MVTIPVNYPERACSECGELFKPKRYATTMVSYCSQACRNRAYYQRLRNAEAMEDEPSPFEWNGEERFSEPVAPPVRHVAVCLSCGRTIRPSERQEWRRAIRERSCGISGCRGYLLIEADDVGHVGSADVSTPIPIRTLTRSRSA